MSALMARAFVSAIPKQVMIFLPLIGACFLINLAYNFWKRDISKIKSVNVNKLDFALFSKMFCLTLACPVSISTNLVIFTTMAESLKTSMFTAMLGGYTGALVGKAIIIAFFGTLGKKISRKILNIINKFSACLLCFYATLFLFKFCKGIINFINM